MEHRRVVVVSKPSYFKPVLRACTSQATLGQVRPVSQSQQQDFYRSALTRRGRWNTRGENTTRYRFTPRRKQPRSISNAVNTIAVQYLPCTFPNLLSNLSCRRGNIETTDSHENSFLPMLVLPLK